MEGAIDFFLKRWGLRANHRISSFIHGLDHRVAGLLLRDFAPWSGELPMEEQIEAFGNSLQAPETSTVVHGPAVLTETVHTLESDVPELLGLIWIVFLWLSSGGWSRDEQQVLLKGLEAARWVISESALGTSPGTESYIFFYQALSYFGTILKRPRDQWDLSFQEFLDRPSFYAAPAPGSEFAIPWMALGGELLDHLDCLDDLKLAAQLIVSFYKQDPRCHNYGGAWGSQCAQRVLVGVQEGIFIGRSLRRRRLRTIDQGGADRAGLEGAAGHDEAEGPGRERSSRRRRRASEPAEVEG